jgi:hypothetical protein
VTAVRTMPALSRHMLARAPTGKSDGWNASIVSESATVPRVVAGLADDA